jgi:hypothetical protein
MRYVLMTYAGPEHAEAWERSSVEDKREEIDAVTAWFGEHGAAGRIVGGEELGRPHEARTVRKKGISDGPFVETKELLGGFIVVEVPDEATALEMARTWPGMRYPSDAVEVRPVGSSPGDADAQAAAEAGGAAR